MGAINFVKRVKDENRTKLKQFAFNGKKNGKKIIQRKNVL